jgi:hypothetical protein
LSALEELGRCGFMSGSGMPGDAKLRSRVKEEEREQEEKEEEEEEKVVTLEDKEKKKLAEIKDNVEEKVVVVSKASFAATGPPKSRPAAAGKASRCAAAASLQTPAVAAASHLESKLGERVGAVRYVQSPSSPPRIAVPGPLLEDADSSTMDDGDGGLGVVTALARANMVPDRARMFDGYYDSADGGGRRERNLARDDDGGALMEELEKEAREKEVRAQEARRRREQRLFKGVVRRPSRGRQAGNAAISAASVARPAEAAFEGEAKSIDMIPRAGATGKDLLRKGYYTYSCLGRAKDAAPLFLEALEAMEDAPGPEVADLRATAMYYYARCLAEQGNDGVDEARNVAMAMDAVNRLIEQHGGHAAARTLLAGLHARAFPGDVDGALAIVHKALAIDPLSPDAVVLRVRLENLQLRDFH